MTQNKMQTSTKTGKPEKKPKRILEVKTTATETENLRQGFKGKPDRRKNQQRRGNKITA